MANRILMTPQELNDCASYIRQRLSSINYEVTLLKNKADEIASRWEGASRQSFINQFESDLYPILRDVLSQVLEGMASEIDTAANTIRETDACLANEFKS